MSFYIESAGGNILSDRQFDVLSLIAQGYNNPQIGHELDYAPTSIKFFARGMYQTLRAINRVNAVRIGHELGILDEVPIMPNGGVALYIGEHLTSRELELMPLLSLGKSDREIAEVMGLAPTTVSRYVDHIEGKLGARNKAHAVHATIKLGLIDLSSSNPAPE